jgi:hypothetical protein
MLSASTSLGESGPRRDAEMLDELHRRIAQFRSAVGERHAKLVTAALIVAGSLVAIVLGPIVYFAFTDVQRAMFLALTWAALILLGFGVYVGCQFLRSLVPERPLRAVASSEPAPGRHVPAYASTSSASTLSVSSPEPPARSTARPGHLLTWSELVIAGIVRLQQQYVGWDMVADEPLYASWDEGMGSELDVGQTGGGKTVRAMARAVQTCQVAQRPCLLIGDCVQGSPRSLVTRLAPLTGFYIREPERTPEGILEIAEELEALMRQRLEDLAAGRHVELYPILGILEEWPELMKTPVARQIEAAVASIARQGSHVRVDVVVCSQPGTKEAIGDLHELIPSRLAFQNAPGHARYVLGREVKTSLYPPGQAAAVIRGRFYEQVQCPLLTTADLDGVASLLPTSGLEAMSEGTAQPLPAKVVPLRPSTSLDGEGARPSFRPSSLEVLVERHKEEVLEALRQGSPVWKAALLIPGVRGQEVTGGGGHQARRAAVQALGEAHGLLPADGPTDTQAPTGTQVAGETQAHPGADEQVDGQARRGE